MPTQENKTEELSKKSGTVYTVERWRSVYEEMLPLLERHWQEVALNHADVPLDIDVDKYNALDDSGCLHVACARRNKQLIGYQVTIVSGHLHYKSTLHAITDVYWIDPRYRHGITATKMFRFIEQDLAKRGVKKLFTSTKLHLDQGRLFEFLGYRPVERLYSKLLKEVE